jgi:hypothetical protein
LVRFIGIWTALFHISWWNQPSAGKVVVTAFRKFWGHPHPLPAKWNNSGCQLLLLLSSVCENVIVRKGQVHCETDRLILPGRMQLPKTGIICYNLGKGWEMLLRPSGIPDVAPSTFSIFRPPKQSTGSQKFEHNSWLRKTVVLSDVSKGFLWLNLLSSHSVQFKRQNTQKYRFQTSCNTFTK